MSFGGSAVGKENISKALRFLAQLCNDDPFPRILVPCTVDEEAEARAHFQEQVMSQESQSRKQDSSAKNSVRHTPVVGNDGIEAGAHDEENNATSLPSQPVKQKNFSISSNTMNTSTSVELADSSVLSTVSDEGHLQMEVDIENAEYNIQLIKLEPKPDDVETSADKNSEEEIPLKATTHLPRRSSTKSHSKRSSRRQKRPPSTSREQHTHFVKKSGGTCRNLRRRSTGALEGSSSGDSGDTIPPECLMTTSNNIEAAREKTKESKQKGSVGSLEPASEPQQIQLLDCKETARLPKNHMKSIKLQKSNLLQKIQSMNQKDSKRCTKQQRLLSSMQEQGRLSKNPEAISRKCVKRPSGITKDQTRETGYKCKVCDKKLSHKSVLDVHMRSHTGEKPFECSVCHEKFAQSGNLKAHQRIHSGERRFECKICHKKFFHKFALKTHLLVHSGERPFKCGICNRAFSDKSDLYRNQKHLHPKK